MLSGQCMLSVIARERGIRTSCRQRGFTLVELQIAIVIMAMISILLLGALRLSSQTWSKVTTRQDAVEHQFLLNQLLRRHISSAQISKVGLTTGETVESPLGGIDYLHYIAPFPSFVNDGRLYWWTLKIAWDEGLQRDALVLDYQNFEIGEQVLLGSEASIEIKGKLIQRLILEPNIASLNIEYLVDDVVSGQEWYEAWHGDGFVNNAALTLLKLQLSVYDPDGVSIQRVWPEIVLALNSVNQTGSEDDHEDELP